MPNSYFQFRQFKVDQTVSGMKVTTDACLFGAWVAREIKSREKEPQRILDIGAGTGLLSLMLAQVTTDTQIDAVEFNEQAFKEAKANFLDSEWNERLWCYHTPIQEYDQDYKYDLIICNPPFFSNSKKGEQDCKNEAIHATNLPMEDLIDAIKKRLSESGLAYILYPEYEMNRLIALTESKALQQNDRIIVRNKNNDSVFRIMVSFSLNRRKKKEDEIVIREPNGKYTDSFWELLKDYYLPYNDPNIKK